MHTCSSFIVLQFSVDNAPSHFLHPRWTPPLSSPCLSPDTLTFCNFRQTCVSNAGLELLVSSGLQCAQPVATGVDTRALSPPPGNSTMKVHDTKSQWLTNPVLPSGGRQWTMNWGHEKEIKDPHSLRIRSRSVETM